MSFRARSTINQPSYVSRRHIYCSNANTVYHKFDQVIAQYRYNNICLDPFFVETAMLNHILAHWHSTGIDFSKIIATIIACIILFYQYSLTRHNKFLVSLEKKIDIISKHLKRVESRTTESIEEARRRAVARAQCCKNYVRDMICH